MMSRKEDFKTELKALLTEYNVCISWDYDDCSDMHGVTGGALSFDTNFGVKEPFGFSTRGTSVDAGDLQSSLNSD